MCILFLPSQLKEKITEAASAEVTNTDGEQPNIVQATGETSAETVPHQGQDPPPLRRSSSGTSTKKAIQEEERLLNDIVSRGEQSMSFQSKVLEMLAPPKATERTAYADWAKEVMIGLHPSLWLKFQRECSNLLYSYQEKSAQLLHSVAQQQPQYPDPQQYPTPQQYSVHHYGAQQQSRAYHSVSPSTSTTSAAWQPPPHQWPAVVQQGQFVWESQDPRWVQSQMNPSSGHHLIQLQPVPLPTMAQRAAPATSSTPSSDGEASFNLSSFVGDNIRASAGMTTVRKMIGMRLRQ